jgi:hypothetical protein
MRAKLLKILGIAIPGLMVFGCAQMGSLSGGQRDVLPPKLLEAFPDNKSTAFNSSEIVLKFNEFVQLKDLNNQLAVSPKLKTTPDISANGKKIVVKLNKAELLPNTTYRFYFGSAIADMHEGNVISNFTYIFSTGSIIDTLSVKGNVTNAFKKDKQKDVIVGLYYNKNLEDSFPFKQTPDYITRSGSDGSFKIENLPEADYRLICFTDKNKDYLYNSPETDFIGFESSVLQLKKDTMINLQLFGEIPERTYIKKQQSENGKGRIILNKKTKIQLRPFISNLQNDFKVVSSDETDTCTFLFRKMSDSLWLLANYSSYGKTITDTLIFKIPLIKSKNKKQLTIKSNLDAKKLMPYEKPQFEFPFWIDTTLVNLQHIHFISKQDTAIQSKKPILKWLSENKLILENNFKEKLLYTIKLDTAAFRAYNGIYNDSAVYSFAISDKKEIGNLSVQITFNLKQPYLIYLLDNNDNIIKEDRVEFSLSSSNSYIARFTQLKEGVYRLKIVYDSNKDGRWNTGDFIKKRQPEKIFVFEKAIKVMPNWETEEEFILKE